MTITQTRHCVAVLGVSLAAACGRPPSLGDCALAAIQYLQPDSLCGDPGCKIIAVDTIVREVGAIQFGTPLIGPIAAVLGAGVLQPLRRGGRHLALGKVSVTPPAPDTLVIGVQFVRPRSAAVDSVLFGVSIVPPSGYLTTYGVVLRAAGSECLAHKRFIVAKT